MLQAMVELGVLAYDLALVPRLLDPLHAAATGTPHRTGKGPRPGAGRHEHRIATTPGGVDRRPVVQGANIDVHRSGCRLIPYHGVPQGRIEGYVLERHSH